ncbi:MAG: dihydrofolate reductase [Saprospiraceae bacterium]|nr:dihydrofolate reductase [Saprospiraceae bacterium]MDZ4704277.1 dihydrofolate reductase [Saprospiraceae bacterium]
MKKILLSLFALLSLASACKQNDASKSNQKATTQVGPPVDTFIWSPESFSDKKIIRYQIPGFDKLSLQQKKLVYYLTQAGYAGRDIIWDQNYRHNLAIRRTMEKVVKNFQGNRNSDDWKAFLLYAKNVWFSSGIHHHYSNDKFVPGFSKEYFISLMGSVGARLSDEALRAMFNPEFDAKKVSQNPEDLLKHSAVNFYDQGISEKEADDFYSRKKASLKDPRVSLGLNSKVIRNSRGQLEERVWKVGGMYGKAITEIVGWLEKAVEVAENEKQGEALKLLIEYYKTGDLVKWDEYNIAWVQATEGDIDYINSFIEVYQDPKGYKGSYESIVQITDFDASKRMRMVAENAQWFETHSPILEAHKKKDVTGISYKVVTVAGEAGDASPSTPIGVNLPNAEWIRADHGSKSVSLGNIIEAYNKADGSGLLNEFAHDYEEKERTRKYGEVAAKLHTALHEVIGHASGQLEEGVATPAETLKNYASPLEEARADLVALYYIMDPKLIQLGLMESQEVGKASYDQYIKNGLMLQLRRIEPGKSIEQAHMRNRQSVASWAWERSQAENVISKVTREGKTFFEINDYEKLRVIFGELLREVQRIKSQGDYEAGKNLIETYGVKVDQQIHAEVLRRSRPLNIPPYGGFINPRLVPVTGTDGEITDIRVEYPDNFMEQMLEYAEKYSFLPDYN